MGSEYFLRGILILMGIICAVIVVYTGLRRISHIEGFEELPYLVKITKGKNKREYNPLTSTVACRAVPMTTAKGAATTWLCDSISAAKKLMKGPLLLEDTDTWLTPNDQVCIIEQKGDPPAPLYSCIDFTYYPDDDGRWAVKGDYDDTCGSLYGTFSDLSGNANRLIKMRDTLADATETAGIAKNDYASLYSTFRCQTKTSGGDKVACDGLVTGQEKMGKEYGVMNDLFTKLVPPAREAQRQRGQADMETRGFKCNVKLPSTLQESMTVIERSINLSKAPAPAPAVKP